MPLPVPVVRVASPESDVASGIPSLPETALIQARGSMAGVSQPDRAEIERELLTRLQEVAVETVFAYLADTETAPAPLIVDLLLAMEGQVKGPSKASG